jgi:hypothetical protein
MSVDFTAVLDVAYDLFNALFPIFIWPIGFMVGIALLGLIIAAIKGVLKFKF